MAVCDCGVLALISIERMRACGRGTSRGASARRRPGAAAARGRRAGRRSAPSYTIRPRSMTTARGRGRARGRRAARPGRSPWPRRRRGRAITAASCSTTIGARPSVGSSISSTVGLPTSARAIASICCSPPESASPRWRRRSRSRGKSSKARSIVQAPGRARDPQMLAHAERGKDLALLRHVAEPRARAPPGRPAGDVAAGERIAARAHAACGP